MGVLRRISREVLSSGTYKSLIEGSTIFDELNGMVVR
jgi:hypothetical protein